jgi:thymidylate synthase (FAD)
MKVVLTYCTPNPEDVIASAAAICYDADTSPEANGERMRKLMELGHLSPLRFANANFHVSEISRVTSHQLVRTAHMGILQRSQRYTVVDDLDYVIPETIAEYWLDEHVALMDDAFTLYHQMIKSGISKEDARYVLPQCVFTELNVTANFQTWYHFLKARLSKGAQWEIKAVAQEIKAALMIVAPTVFGDL